MTENLFKLTADLLGIKEEIVRDYCCGGDENALEIVTPEQLAEEMRQGCHSSIFDSID